MNFQAHYSSSHGNLYTVTANNGRRLLLEAGCRWSKLREAIGNDLMGIEACLLSHEHKDHSHAVCDVMKNGIDVYASAGTWGALAVPEKLIHRGKNISAWGMANTGSFEAHAFDVRHDAAEPLGFGVLCDNEKLLFATDTAYLKQDFRKTQFDIIAICCNYDYDILQHRVDTLSIDPHLAKRLLLSHASVTWVKNYLRDYMDLGRCREIQLLHTSDGNLNKEKARSEIEDEFGVRTFIAGEKP